MSQERNGTSLSTTSTSVLAAVHFSSVRQSKASQAECSRTTSKTKRHGMWSVRCGGNQFRERQFRMRPAGISWVFQGVCGFCTNSMVALRFEIIKRRASRHLHPWFVCCVCVQVKLCSGRSPSDIFCVGSLDVDAGMRSTKISNPSHISACHRVSL